ncbi:MAG: FHA domain-containing protein [Anaerolineaceae bacterium]|nr:FHA domain-containing protein [Anaerolineaceae bacterium]
MIVCPNCHHKELPGALFCSECGARLISLDYLTTQSIKKTNTDNLDESMVEELKDKISSAEDSFSKHDISSDLALYLIEAKQTLQLAGRSEYTLGRIAEGQPILPDVDLSPFDAYAQGVSRLHAALKINKNRIAIMDLGSSNGTRVNGQKIVPHVDYPISHNDQIALGKLRIQILIK